MNLITTELLILREAFNAIEGPNFYDSSIRRVSGYSILNALTWAVKCRDTASNYASKCCEIDQKANWQMEFEKALKLMDNKIIYGSGGFHRYLVKANGDVLFSTGHAVESMITKASSVGFVIY